MLSRTPSVQLFMHSISLSLSPAFKIGNEAALDKKCNKTTKIIEKSISRESPLKLLQMEFETSNLAACNLGQFDLC